MVFHIYIVLLLRTFKFYIYFRIFSIVQTDFGWLVNFGLPHNCWIYWIFLLYCLILKTFSNLSYNNIIIIVIQRSNKIQSHIGISFKYNNHSLETIYDSNFTSKFVFLVLWLTLVYFKIDYLVFIVIISIFKVLYIILYYYILNSFYFKLNLFFLIRSRLLEFYQ